MTLTFPMWPVYLVDMGGSVISLLIAAGCVAEARRLFRKDRTHPLWTYFLWISMTLAVFTLCRSSGHIVKYLLIVSGHRAFWHRISPISGAVNSITFVVVGALTFYYERIRVSYRVLREERNRIRKSEARLAEAHDKITRLLKEVGSDGDLSLRYANPSLIPCWEIKGCREEKCPAYGSENYRCWHIAMGFCCPSGGGEENAFQCEECEIYHEAHRDPIQRVGEQFNDMMFFLEKRSNELKEVNRRLREIDRKKTRFLDVVAHDIRTPLTSILSYADLLLRYQSESVETRNEFLKTIIHESNRLAELVNDYLDLSRIESGLMEYKIMPLDFHEVVQEAIAVHSSTARQKKIEIQDSIGDGSLPLEGDPKRLIQVMSNLLGNAVKFTPPGGKIEIEGSLSPDGKTVRIAVLDTGPGIPEDHLQKIFQTFVQVQEGRLHSVGGSGLGLSICWEIVGFHGGRIWASNREEGGAAFHLTLPATHPDDTPSSESEPIRSSRGSPSIPPEKGSASG